MIILGVDPGSHRTGFGAIETDGRRHRLLEMGTIAPSPRLELPLRLRAIHAPSPGGELHEHIAGGRTSGTHRRQS